MIYANKLSVTKCLDRAGEVAVPKMDVVTVRRHVRHYGGSIRSAGEAGRSVVFYFIPRSGLPSDLVAPRKEVEAK